jgi:hypothetical protein
VRLSLTLTSGKRPVKLKNCTKDLPGKRRENKERKKKRFLFLRRVIVVT